VKLGRHLPTRQQVAIKIVQRYSKRRRLGKLGDPEDKVKKEVAILKKARHPNVVSLLEVIDDPNRQKVYIVLEYVENGEIKWRKKGLKEIIYVDKLRIEREKNGIPDSPSFLEEHHQYVRRVQQHRRLRERAREKRQTQLQTQQPWAWSLEHGGESDDELGSELSVIRTISRNIQENPDVPSPSQSYNSSTSEFERRMRESTLAAVEGSMYGPYVSDYPSERRFSATSSILGYASSEPDWFSDDDDMSYVPCLTIAEARCAFRDAVLGLEYLHYQGIIHRDIKPANLLVTSNYRVKISDFGVSYLGRPIRDDDEEQVTETDATELDDARGELSKTVGTPAFYAPELCYTDDDFVDAHGRAPKITGAIDIWSLGVTLYGMIFGRLPFVSDDKFSLFQTIGKKDVFIPSKRLKPVEAEIPSHPSEQRNYVMNSNKRMDDELVYEDIDDTLRELLQRLLTKDPNKRITIKEIKHHPWVLQGLPNPLAWVEETDPSYQSKGKRIEVSNEEVTSAVSKVPFVDRFRSGVAKLSGLIVGRKESRRRTPSAAGSTDRAPSKDVREGRRASLRGDEEMFRSAKPPRESDHPLSHSITASPDTGDESRLDPTKCEATPTADGTPRPHGPERAASATSTADSTKTVRPFTSEVPLSMHPVDTLSSPNFGGLFSGAGHGLARRFQSAEQRSRSVDHASVDGDGRSEPSLALSVASATGQVQSPGPLRDEGYFQAGLERHHRDCSSGSGHRRHRSCQLPHDSSAEPFPLAKEMLLRQTTLEKEPIADDDRPPSRLESEMYSNDCPPFEREAPHEDAEWESSDKGGLTTSPPSAATISSSSVDEYTSGMSQSASHPSIPSVLSGASSLSGDGFHVSLKERGKESEQPSYVPAILRTGDTITAENFLYRRLQEDEEYRYDCDDEDGDSEDEGIVLGQKKRRTSRGEGATA
jgi:serine/threonine protein kinase